MRIWILAAVGGFALIHAAVAAQPIDCDGPITQAGKSIDKITGDLQGMDKMMAKPEISQLHGLVGEAQRLLAQARQSCGEKSAFSKTKAIAQADSANGYATAADVLHFHYMEAGSGGMKGMQKGAAGAMPGMGGMETKMPGMSGGMKK